MEESWSSKMLVSYHINTWYHNPENHDIYRAQFIVNGEFGRMWKKAILEIPS